MLPQQKVAQELRRKPLIVRVLQRYWRLSRGLTFEVSACVIDDDNQIRLAKSAEDDGWRLPLGMVRGGETLEGALRRTLRTDFGIEVLGKSELTDISSNDARSQAHKVGHFVVRHWRAVPTPTGVEVASFPLNKLPTVSAVTRARIDSAVKDRASPETC